MRNQQMRRGDIVICVISGDYGKPRPAVVVQSDLFNPTHPSVVVCPITSHLTDAHLFRLPLKPLDTNGLSSESQIMVDKLTTIKVEKVREKVGNLSKHETQKLDDALKLWLNLID